MKKKCSDSPENSTNRPDDTKSGTNLVSDRFFDFSQKNVRAQRSLFYPTQPHVVIDVMVDCRVLVWWLMWMLCWCGGWCGVLCGDEHVQNECHLNYQVDVQIRRLCQSVCTLSPVSLTLVTCLCAIYLDYV